MPIQGETPTLSCTIDNIDVSDCRIFFTVYDGQKTIVKEVQNPQYDNTNTVFAVAFTQQETLSMLPGNAETEVTVINSSGVVRKSRKVSWAVRDTLMRRVVSYE